MGLVENILLDLTQCGEIIDIEEAAVVNVVRSHAPERQSICLSLNQLMQLIKGVGVARLTIELRDRPLNEVTDRGGSFAKSEKPMLVNLFVARPFGPCFRRDFLA